MKPVRKYKIREYKDKSLANFFFFYIPARIGINIVNNWIRPCRVS